VYEGRQLDAVHQTTQTKSGSTGQEYDGDMKPRNAYEYDKDGNPVSRTHWDENDKPTYTYPGDKDW
jgi:hypothetical protein